MIKKIVQELGRLAKFGLAFVIVFLAASLIPGDNVGGNVVGTLALIVMSLAVYASIPERAKGARRE